MHFNPDEFYGYLLKGHLLHALHYLQECEGTEALQAKYHALFTREQYLSFDLPPALHSIMLCYQQYYRDTFYLSLPQDTACAHLAARLASALHRPATPLDDLEQYALPALFISEGFQFLGGRTSGYYGPYIWRTTKSVTYCVELPGGKQPYTVKLLESFITRSWLDYLTFGAVTPGGWTDVDGTINCIKASYDLNSEAFTISLLKHEAQHARDLAIAPQLSSAVLEYRAKLVELIYSTKRNLLLQFAHEADPSNPANGHCMAAHRICLQYAAILGHNDFASVSTQQIQSIARNLFDKSTLD